MFEIYVDVDYVESSLVHVQTIVTKETICIDTRVNVSHEINYIHVSQSLNCGDDGLCVNHSENGDDSNEGDIPYESSYGTNVEGDFDGNIDVEVPPTFVASSLITSMVNEDPSIQISLIQKQISSQFGYKVSKEGFKG
ncbi:hypothetical protein CR513_17373, partial [Mucuna pruriens]